MSLATTAVAGWESTAFGDADDSFLDDVGTSDANQTHGFSFLSTDLGDPFTTSYVGTGTAHAAFDSLGALGSILITNGRSFASGTTHDPDKFFTIATASFTDNLTPTATEALVGFMFIDMTLTGSVDKSADIDGNLAIGLSLVDKVGLSLTSITAGITGGPFTYIGGGVFRSPPIGVTFGLPVDVEITLTANATVMSTTPNNEKFNVDFVVDYLSTASLDGAYLTDDNGAPVAGGGVSAESGTTYAITPEPGVFALLGMGGLALMRRKSTRGNRATS